MKAAILCLLVASALAGCGSNKSVVADNNSSDAKYDNYIASPTIDGKIEDWNPSAFTFQSSLRIFYAVANDTSNIYIAIRFQERSQQMKFLRGGMEIWLDDADKKKQKTGVRFPIPEINTEMPSGQAREGLEEEIRRKAKEGAVELELIGFKESFNGRQSIYSQAQVKAVFDWDTKGVLYYELAIPFTSLPHGFEGSVKNISIGLLLKPLVIPGGNGGAPGGRPPGSSGGFPGGGRPPGGRPPGGGGMDSDQMLKLTQEEKIWITYSIVRK
jgi:hypothetical protein